MNLPFNCGGGLTLYRTEALWREAVVITQRRSDSERATAPAIPNPVIA